MIYRVQRGVAVQVFHVFRSYTAFVQYLLTLSASAVISPLDSIRLIMQKSLAVPVAAIIPIAASPAIVSFFDLSSEKIARFVSLKEKVSFKREAGQHFNGIKKCNIICSFLPTPRMFHCIGRPKARDQ